MKNIDYGIEKNERNFSLFIFHFSFFIYLLIT